MFALPLLRLFNFDRFNRATDRYSLTDSEIFATHILVVLGQQVFQVEDPALDRFPAKEWLHYDFIMPDNTDAAISQIFGFSAKSATFSSIVFFSD